MIKDKVRWEARYKSGESTNYEPDELIVENKNLLKSGFGADLACGNGRNGFYLSKLGYSMVCVDISQEALKSLQQKALMEQLPIYPVIADLDYFPLPGSSFDLIAVFYFYDPHLMEHISNSLKPGGILFYSTYNESHTSVKPGFNPDYLIPKGELEGRFSDFDIVLSDDNAGPSGNISQIIALKGP